MKILNVFIICLLIVTNSYSQSFYIKSNKVKLDIKFPPPDSTKPTISINLPDKLEGFPVYSKDTVYSLTGKIYDNSESSSIMVNNKTNGIFHNGEFRLDIPLHYGENKINIRASDRRKNTSELSFVIFQDPNADVLPPIIKLETPIITHSRGLTVVKRDEMNDTIVIKGKVTDESEILGLWVNNDKIDTIGNGEFYYNFKGQIPDSIVVKAADSYGNLSSIAAKVTTDVSLVNNETIEVGKYYALLIGVEEYRDININDLMFPLDDCESLYNELVKDYIFDPENVLVLKNPTREEIIKNLQNLRKKLTEKDNLLVFYAGHGFMDKEIQQGYWLPADAGEDPTNWLSNSSVRDYIKGIDSKHTLLISDACFSGAIFNTREAFIKSNPAISEIYKYKSRRALTSGALNAVPDKSVFVEYLIKRLKENKKKFLTTQELYISFKDAVINNSKTNQTPQYGVIQNADDEDLGDFIFIKR